MLCKLHSFRLAEFNHVKSLPRRECFLNTIANKLVSFNIYVELWKNVSYSFLEILYWFIYIYIIYSRI